MPGLVYGTAWKEERTTELTRLALDAGFVGIDTANQRKHYDEVRVGRAIAEVAPERASLFLQSKFTYRRGQDHRLPYDAGADVATQVAQSFASSLEHLGTDYLDSFLLHGPETGAGLTATDWRVWRAMEALHKEGRTRLIGVSNVAASQLAELCDGAEVSPAVVQNRCYASAGWDREVRAMCGARGAVYQGFSLLTANARELNMPAVRALAARAGATVPQVVFRFAQRIGIVALTGTSSPIHMAEDLASGTVELTDDDVQTLESIGV